MNFLLFFKRYRISYFMNFKRFPSLLIICFLSFHVLAQYNINGSFPPLAGQQVKLVGFQDFGIYTIDSTIVSKQGNFKMSYSDKDQGMGYLSAADNEAYFVVLANENIQLKGQVFSLPETITTLSGNENKLFTQYALEHPRREQALSAWDYLTKIYTLDTLFAVQPVPKQAIATEKQRIKAEDSLFLATLPKYSYVSYYLPLRKLVSSVSTIAQYRTEEIPSAIATFRNMDYTDPRLYKSGLLKETIESHFWLIENSGRSLDSVFSEMNISIDFMLGNLAGDPKKLNEITDFLFKLLERRSLFKPAEYLALKVLNEVSCTINDDLIAKLESYRAMKIGNIAPDFDFEDDCFAPGYDVADSPKKLSDIKCKYTVVIFAASWCPQCPEELSQIGRLYQKWKTNDVEVVHVSLDDDEQIFRNFTSIFPFISVCDYQKWDSPVANAYHVFATPTIYLLNDKQEILLKPTSVRQLDSWVDWYLVQGNK